MRSSAVLLLFLCAVIEVCSQTFPYVSFMGVHLSNHSYINLTQVGDHGDDAVQCVTNLSSCCTITQGEDRGNWYQYFIADETKLVRCKGNNSKALCRLRKNQRVELRRRNNNVTSGMYLCVIEANGTNTGFLYVGLYASGGN